MSCSVKDDALDHIISKYIAKRNSFGIQEVAFLLLVVFVSRLRRESQCCDSDHGAGLLLSDRRNKEFKTKIVAGEVMQLQL